MHPIVTFLIFLAIDFVPTALYAVGRVSVQNGVDYCIPLRKMGGMSFLSKFAFLSSAWGRIFYLISGFLISK